MGLREPVKNPKRTALLAAAGGLAIAPAAAMAASTAPPPDEIPKAEFAYEAIVALGAPETIGETPFGKRVRIPILGGTFKGPRINGTVFPEGMDWQLIRPDGMAMLDASYLMREADGTVIHVHNKGLAGKGYVRTTTEFEVPTGPHAWLNEAMFVGTVGPVPEVKTPAVRIRIYKLT